MKKGDIVEGVIDKYSFPNKGSFVHIEEIKDKSGEKVIDTIERTITVKGALPGQTVKARIKKKKEGKADAILFDVTKKSPQETKKPMCNHFYSCGGCTYQTFAYTNQLKLKEQMVKELLGEVIPSLSDNSKDTAFPSGGRCPEGADEEPSPRGEGGSRRLTDEVFKWEGILSSPDQFRYRNKMEFTFGDAEKDGPLTLGLHRRNSTHDIISIDSCALVSPAWNEILKYTQKFYRDRGVPHYNKRTHTGVLRNLVIRESATDGSILVNLVTTTHHSIDEYTREIPWNEKRSETVDELCLPEYVAGLLSLGETSPVGMDGYSSHGYNEGRYGSKKKKVVRDKNGVFKNALIADEEKGGSGEFESLSKYNRIVGVLYTECDTLADAIIPDTVTLLYGQDFLMEEVLGLKFKISPFSFFQTNTKGSEVLYSKAREYAMAAITEDSDSNAKSGKTGVIYDLYSGTGTIAQMMSPVADKVYGIEIIEEAVEAAKENAKLNKLKNCEFIAGDVLKKLDELDEKPDLIILDPPRDGVNPKALNKILSYGVNNLVYISCKPTSLVRDIKIFKENGYEPVKGCCVDMFPNTQHVETCVLLGLKDVDDYMYIDYEPDHHIVDGGKATYREITEYVQEHYGLKVTSLDIAQVKDKCNLSKRKNYYTGKEGHKVPQVTEEKEQAIREAFKQLGLI